MNLIRSLFSRRALVWLAALSLSLGSVSAAPLKVAYSDWPGWTAFAIAAEKGWFKEAGVDVELLWFEYGPSMEAFTAGKVDAVMVTNGDARLQRDKIACHDLQRFFGVVVIEGEFGCGKPDQRVFRHALEALGVPARGAWMVGDRLDWDVEGAQKVGLGGIWIDRDDNKSVV